MNISELLQSTQYVGNKSYGPKNTFANKQLGQIYLYNKQVKAKTGHSVIEISMMIKAVTEKNVSYHKVMMAIGGVNQRTVQGITLVRELEAMNDKYKGMAYEDVIIEAIQNKPFPDKTVIQNEAGTFTIIDDNVSKDNRIMVWCSCSNYYWVWQYYNVENKVDIFNTAPPKYNPRTEAGREALKANKPMRNPGRHAGMCKHLLLLLALLMDPDGNGGSGLVKEARSVTRNFKANIDRFQKVDRLTKRQYENIVQKWESERAGINRERGVKNDPALQKKKKTNWRSIQKRMVGD